MTTTASTTPAPGSGSLLEMLMRFFRRKLQSMGVDTRFFLEVMKDDEAGIIARRFAGGVVMYINFARDLIPDRFKVLGLIDDIIVMTIGMSLCINNMPPERRAHYEEGYPAVKELAADIDQLQRYLSLIWEQLLSYVRDLSRRRYRGQPMEVVVDTPDLREALYDQTMEYLAAAAIDPDTLDEELKMLPRAHKIAGLLIDGLDRAEDAGKPEEIRDAPVGWARLNRILGRDDGDAQLP